MERLTIGLYEKKGKKDKRLFGLKCTQEREKEIRVVKYGSWYNKHGERLGFGDLSGQDINRIKWSLRLNEMFVILNTQTSKYNFIDEKKVEVSSEIENPGVDYVALCCFIVLIKGVAYYVSNDIPNSRFEFRKYRFRILKRKEAMSLIKEWDNYQGIYVWLKRFLNINEEAKDG